MPDRVKGITIEIDGDTKGLSQSLKTVNKDIKTTQTQLKDVDKLLKLDPHNVTLLSQKMSLLGKEINSTKDKLSQLKSVQDQMDEGLKNGSITVEQYQSWQREIIQTENELKNLEAELKNVPSAAQAMGDAFSEQMDKIGRKVSSVGDSVASIGDTMSRTVTAGIVAAGAASVAAWRDVDNAMDTIVAKTGATGEELEAMEGIAHDIAKTIPTDFSTAALAVAEVSTRFDSTGEQLEDLSTAFIQFANLNGTDVVGSIDSVSSMMKAWGVDASDTLQILDLLNGVGQQTGVSVGSLSDSLQSNALTFRELDLDLAQAATLLGQMDKNGIDASAGITALRRAMSKATDENKTLNEVMAEWQELMNSSASDAEKLAATEDLFGSRAYGQLFNALQQGNISFTEVKASMSDFEGNLKRTFEATLDPADEFTTTMNELKELGAELGETILPVLVDVLNALKPILEDIKAVWESMSPEDQRALIENLGKLALIGPALSFTGRTISGIGAGIGAIGRGGKWIAGLFGSGGSAAAASAGASAGASVGGAAATSFIGGLGTALAGAAIGAEVGKLGANYVIGPILDFFGSDDAKWYKDFKFFGDGGFFDSLGWIIKDGFEGSMTDIFKDVDTSKMLSAITDVSGGFEEAMYNLGRMRDLMGEDYLPDMENALREYYGVLDEASEHHGFLDHIREMADATKADLNTTMDGAEKTTKEKSESITDKIKGLVTTVDDSTVSWKDGLLTMTSSMDEAWAEIDTTSTEMEQGVTSVMDEMCEKVKSSWMSMGELFQEGFDIKLPHFTMTGGVAPYGMDGQGSLPKWNVDWYANGGILTQPTIFGMSGGRFLGGGEAGAEAVLPLSHLDEMITKGMTAAMGGQGDTVINVSLNNQNLGSVLLTAQQMMTLRRGK